MFKKLNLSFTVRKNKARANGEVPIYMRINVAGCIKELSTGEKILPADWDSKLTKAKGNSTKAKYINSALETLVFKAKQSYQELLQEGVDITAEAVKDRITGEDQEEEEVVSVLEVFTLHNEKMKKQIGNGYSKSTYKKYRTAKKHMENYLLEYHNDKEYPVSEIDLAFLEDFVEYLKTKEDPCANNTARKYLTNFQKVVNLARRKNWLKVNPYENFKMKYEQKSPTFLTLEEVRSIYEKDFDIERIERVRDVFVFSCYTGFSFSDVSNLSKTDLQRDSEGRYFIQQSRVKTNKPALVPLLSIPLKIINKYADDPETREGNLLPMISNQKTNAYLKEIADICGIHKRLTFHVARHTCATLLLNLDMHIETVQHILGHSDLRTTQHYAKLSQSKINADMEKISEKLS